PSISQAVSLPSSRSPTKLDLRPHRWLSSTTRLSLCPQAQIEIVLPRARIEKPSYHVFLLKLIAKSMALPRHSALRRHRLRFFLKPKVKSFFNKLQSEN
ncbi:hypothetical protein Dimus_016029, partial [Dionaea muscipula]